MGHLISSTVTGLSWPVAVTALAFRFRTEIRKKFQDIEEAGPSGVKFRRQDAQIPEGATKKPLSPSQRDLTPFQKTIRESIAANLERFHGEDTKIGVLLDELAVTREMRVFEGAFAQIFGSQIRALEEPESAGGTSTPARAMEYFENVRRSQPDFYANASFEDWSRYLVVHQFVEIDRDKDRVILTDVGRDFICFVTTQKNGIARPF